MSIKSFARRWIDSEFPRFARLARRLRDRVVATRRTAYRTRLGFLFFGDRDIDVSRDVTGELGRFTDALREVDLVVDIGANCGFFTAVAAQARKRVIAVEPHPVNLELLHRCLLANGFDAEVFPIALSDRPGIVSLYGGGQGASLIQGWGNIASNYVTSVHANTLDNLLAGRAQGRRILVKLDVEGAEYQVLKGADATLARVPAPIWIVEHGLTENFEQRNPNYFALFERFWAAGYEARAIEEESRWLSKADVEAWWHGSASPVGMYYEFRIPE